MLEDKLKTTDWEATNEAIEEQVARESYLQWIKDNERRKAKAVSATVTSGELRQEPRLRFRRLLLRTITCHCRSHVLNTNTINSGSSSPKAGCSNSWTSPKPGNRVRECLRMHCLIVIAPFRRIRPRLAALQIEIAQSHALVSKDLHNTLISASDLNSSSAKLSPSSRVYLQTFSVSPSRLTIDTSLMTSFIFRP
jgi:hypothetical protein